MAWPAAWWAKKAARAVKTKDFITETEGFGSSWGFPNETERDRQVAADDQPKLWGRQQRSLYIHAMAPLLSLFMHLAPSLPTIYTLRAARDAGSSRSEGHSLGSEQRGAPAKYLP